MNDLNARPNRTVRAATITKYVFALGAVSLGLTGRSIAQNIAEVTLPDAPGFSSSADRAEVAPSTGTVQTPHPPAGPFQREVLAGQSAQRMTVNDKILFGLRGTISPLEAAGWVLSASYEQLGDGSPNYGQTFKGFSQRLGAEAARDASSNIAGESVIAPILHEDPRYYQLGKGQHFVKRVVYAATRTVFTRTDGGRQTVNFQLLGGHLAAASLTQLYYPPLNRSFSEVAKTFAFTVGDTGVGFLIREFAGAILEAKHSGQ